jgi:hypothetical protein
VASRKKKSDARPRCRECGKLLDPKKTFVIRSSRNFNRDVCLVGLYCCADHVLDAWNRGVAGKE